MLVTGGAGFIGARFVRLALASHSDWSIMILDAMTYAGNLERLGVALTDARVRFAEGDITSQAVVEHAMQGCDAVINFAAETHVDRAIAQGVQFARSNVVGVQVLLEAARLKSIARFVQVSTDEVYGPLPAPELATEAAPVRPDNPYAATKAGADLLVEAFHHTHGLPVLITRGCNTYGPWQYPEKAIPRWITAGLHGEELPVYGSGLHVRDWLYVDDHCTAIMTVLERGIPGSIYNVGAHEERRNIEVARSIASHLDLGSDAVISVDDRPGHDPRYGLDSARLEALGWHPQTEFGRGLIETIEWYRNHRSWWESAIDRNNARSGPPAD